MAQQSPAAPFGAPNLQRPRPQRKRSTQIEFGLPGGHPLHYGGLNASTPRWRRAPSRSSMLRQPRREESSISQRISPEDVLTADT